MRLPEGASQATLSVLRNARPLVFLVVEMGWTEFIRYLPFHLPLDMMGFCNKEIF
jgi:hypothetical protein